MQDKIDTLKQLEKDYSEILCQAMEIIAQQMLDQQSFDKTQIYTITDDSKREEGKYTVSDGSVIFEAYSENTKYQKNTQVYVTIPMGDFSAKKIITGRVQVEDVLEPITYVPASEKMVVRESFPREEEIPIRTLQIAANNDIEDEDGNYIQNIDGMVYYPPIDIISGNYNALNISADFKTLLPATTVSGNYGLMVILYGEENKKLKAILLDSSSFFGNPYLYSGYINVSQTFDISDVLIPIKRIDLVLYEQGNFNDDMGNVILVPKDEEGKLLYNNIFVRNIKLNFGSDVSKWEDNSVEIFTNDSLGYMPSAEPEQVRTIYINFYNKDKNNKYIGFEDATKNYEVIVETCITEGTWLESQRVLNGETSFTVEPLFDKAKYMVRVKIHEYDAQKDNELLGTYISNILTFENTNPNVGSDATRQEQEGLVIVHGANSQDHYMLYGGDMRLVGGGSGKRVLTIGFKAENRVYEPDAILKEASIYWYVPNAATMLRASSITDKQELVTDESDDKDMMINGCDCYKLVGDFNDDNLPVFKYSLANVYVEGLKNNIIKCKIVSKSGVFTAEKTFTFATSGTFGTDHTIDLRLAEGYYGFDYGKECKIRYSYHKKDIGEVNTADLGAEPKFKIYDLVSAKDNQLIWDSTTSVVKDSWMIELSAEDQEITLSKDWRVEGEQHFIYITMEMPIPNSSLVLETDCVIPCYGSSDSVATYVQAPDTVIYNATGQKPVYASDTAIVLLNRGGNGDPGQEEPKLMSFDRINQQSNLPDDLSIIIKNNGYYLSVPESYWLSSGGRLNENDVNYAIAFGDCIIWPLNIFLNKYGYSTLNQWDGSFKLDEKENYLLASMVGAGRKNASNNTFSGVIMGDLAVANGGSTPVISKFGLYGFGGGLRTFALENDGSCTLGDQGQLSLTKENNSWSLKIQPDKFSLVANNGNLVINSHPDGNGDSSSQYYLNINNILKVEDDDIITLAGFEVSENTLTSGSYGNNEFVLISSGHKINNVNYAFMAGNKFKVDTEGNLTANNAIIQSPELAVGNIDSYMIQLSDSFGFTASHEDKILLQLNSIAGIQLTSPNFSIAENIPSATESIYNFSLVRPQIKLSDFPDKVKTGELNIRSSKSYANSKNIIGTSSFDQETDAGDFLYYCIINDSTIQNDKSWISILVTLTSSGKYIPYRVTAEEYNINDFPKEKNIGYIYNETIGKENLIFNLDDANTILYSDVDRPKIIPTSVHGSQLSLNDIGGNIILSNGDRFITIGGEYAIQVGDFKIDWDGKQVQ